MRFAHPPFFGIYSADAAIAISGLWQWEQMFADVFMALMTGLWITSGLGRSLS
jgi:hypothetical protein